MTDIKKLLELRKEMKKKRPDFIRHDAHKKRLKKKWVKPKGLHNKMRLNKRGHAKPVSIGYGSPKAVRGLSKEGLHSKIVRNKKELLSINKEKEAAIISSTVGVKKKLLLLQKAKEHNIKIVNLNVDEFLKKKEEELKKKHEKKKKKAEEKKKEEPEKKVKLEEKISEEEKKEQEKREKDKLLTKREI